MSIQTQSATTAVQKEGSRWRVRTGVREDYAAVSDMLVSVYGTGKSAQEIRWLYEKNPAGPCLLWIAEEESTGRVVSVNPMFPWRVSVAGREVTTAQAGDAATLPEFQGRGIWGALVKAAWTDLRACGMSFTFSFPNPGALSVFQKTTPKVGIGPRAGSYAVLTFQRMTCPIALRAVAGKVPGGKPLAWMLDPFYGQYLTAKLSVPGSLTFFPVVRFDGEFDALWKEIGHTYGALVVRNSRHLNWRFMEAPSGAFRALALRDAGALVGYVIYERDGLGDGWIADMFCRSEPRIFSSLLRGALLSLRHAGCAKVSTWMARESPFFEIARSVGFIPRAETFPMAVHVLEDGPDSDILLDPRRWWAWFGDRDVERLGDGRDETPQAERRR